MKRNNWLKFFRKWVLFFVFWVGLAPLQAQPLKETFLIVQNQAIGHLNLDSLAFEPWLKLDHLKIFRRTQNRSARQFSCRTLNLAQPMDSVLNLIFHTSRRLQSAALMLNFNDTCDVQILSHPEFKTFALPVKELNLFLSDKLVQDEIYIDLDLFNLFKDQNIDLAQILLFEYLFQQFLQEKIATGRVFSPSIFSVLIEDYQPVYAPELHLYLDSEAASALIKKWENIKQAWKKQIFSSAFPEQVKQFKQKLKLVCQSDYNRLIGFSRMLVRYGYFKPVKTIGIQINPKTFNLLRKNMTELTNYLIVYWFRPGKFTPKTIESLKNEIGNKKLLIFKE